MTQTACGLGGLTAERFDRSVREIAVDYAFRRTPAMTEIFDDSFLPSTAGRKID